MKRFLLMFSLAAMLLPTSLFAQQAVQRWSQSAPTARSFPAPLATATIAGQRFSNDKIKEAMQALKDAESESDKDEARDELRGLLEEQYDESLDRYEEYLAEMEEKIKELRKQLDRRRDARMEMVDLRLQVLISDAEGLGWPEQYFSGPGVSGLSPFYSVTPGQVVLPPTAPKPARTVPAKRKRGGGVR